MNNISTLNGTGYKGIARTSQGMVERVAHLQGSDLAHSSLAQVVKVYPESMSCDLLDGNGNTVFNVPILTTCGLEEDEVWGTMELPSVESYVVVLYLGDRQSFPFIIGSLFPFANNKYQSSQKTANSDDKAFTKKLLEKIDPKVYRKVFKNGTSIEVKEDGTILVETPSGTSFQIDETAKKITLQHKDGSNLCTLALDAANGFDLKDKDNNEVISSSSGMILKDKNGNEINMGSTSVKINNNLEVLQ